IRLELFVHRQLQRREGDVREVAESVQEAIGERAVVLGTGRSLEGSQFSGVWPIATREPCPCVFQVCTNALEPREQLGLDVTLDPAHGVAHAMALALPLSRNPSHDSEELLELLENQVQGLLL